MAATFDGFSIRGYTSKMRSIDVFKCWPFLSNTSPEVSREQVQSWLPPMPLCPRSNHLLNPPSAGEDFNQGDHHSSEEESDKSEPPPLSDDANSDNEDDKVEMICPVCREFNAATLTAVNAHMDGCLAQTMLEEERRHIRMMNLKSSKSKARKKRSIAEIFKFQEEQQQPQQEPQIESVFNCWTFSDDVSNTVTKFQWLSRRLEALRSTPGAAGESAKSNEGDSSEEKSDMVCPVCRDFNAATVTAVNAHIDSCLAQAVREERRQMRRTVTLKHKPKAPKKRSIAEILTAPLPRIEACKSKAIQVEEEEDKSEYACGDSTTAAHDPSSSPSAIATPVVVSVIKKKKSTTTSKKKKKIKKVKKKRSKVEKHVDNCVSFVKSEKRTVVSRKKVKKRNVFNNGTAGKKGDAYQRMVQTTVNSSRKLKGTIGNKMVSLHEVDPSLDRKKLGLNCLSVEKKALLKDYDSVGKQEEALSPVHDILKNRLKHVSGKTSSGSYIRDGTEESRYNAQKPTSDRLAKFTGIDDILVSKKTNSFDETMFNISSDVLASSVVKEKSSGSDEETAILEPNRNYDHVENKQGSVQNFLKPCTSKQLEEKSELLTKVAVCDNNSSQFFCGGNETTLPCSPYANISRPLSTVQEEQMSGVNTQACESGSFSYSGKLDHFDNPQVDVVNSNENTKTFLDPSSSYSASYNANEKPESPLQNYRDKDNSVEAMGDRQLSHMFSADMNDNSFPFTSWEKGKNSCLDPNFYGLPLNSQGELMNFSSSGNLGMNQSETSCTLRGSFSGLPVNNILHQSNQENLSFNETHVRKTFPHHPARLGATELHSREREDIYRPNSNMSSSHYVPPLNSELNLKQNSFSEHNQCDQIRNHNGNRVISDHISLSSSQPTMRLMGKDVPIGKSSQEMQQFAGDVWTDEETRRRNYSEYAAFEHSLLGRSSKQDWVSGSPLQISADNALQSAKIQSNQKLQTTILMRGTDSGFSQQFVDLQSNHASQNGRLEVNRNPSSYFNPMTQKSNSYAVFNGASCDFPEQFIPGAKPLGLSSQSVVLTTPDNFRNCGRLSNGEMNERNKNPHVTKSAFGFPFLQPTVTEQAKTSWFRCPYRSSPSWLSNSTDEMVPGTFPQQFSGTSSQSFPQNLWGNNFTTASVKHSAEVRFPTNHLTCLSPMQTTALSAASIVQPPYVPVKPSAINNGNRNINKVDYRLMLDDHHPCRKRSTAASNLDDSRKSSKLQENLSSMSRLTGEKSGMELQRNTRALELDPHTGSAGSRCCQHEAQHLNPASYPAVNSFKLDGMVTSSPVRLGPKRAKHVLKSS